MNCYLKYIKSSCLLISTSLCLATCTSSDVKKTTQTEEQEKILEKAKNEREIGRNMAGRLLRFYGPFNDRKMVRYVNEVGNYVASRSEYPQRRFMFDILNTEDINAFACPGGYILLTLGTIRNAKTEAELAAVIAHEIAHVGKEHMLNTLSKLSEDELSKIGKEKVKLTDDIIVRKRPDAKSNKAGDIIAKYAGSSIAGLNALKAAKAGMSIILEKGLGSNLEFEADLVGTQYTVESGYDPYALTEYLCRIYTTKGHSKSDCYSEKKRKKKSKQISILDKTHPSVPMRIAHIMKYLKQVEADKIIGAKGRKRFLNIQKRLPKKKLTPNKKQPS